MWKAAVGSGGKRTTETDRNAGGAVRRKCLPSKRALLKAGVFGMSNVVQKDERQTATQGYIGV